MAEPARQGAGHPRLPGSVKYIQLRESVFTLWRKRKGNSGFGNSTDSEFAEYLLHRRYGNFKLTNETVSFNNVSFSK